MLRRLGWPVGNIPGERRYRVDNTVADLIVHASLVTDDFGQALAGGDQTFAFHRLFGDSDGDKDVDSADALRFRQAQNTLSTSSAYRAWFDSDSDGDIDSVDALRFRQRQNTVFTY